MLSMLFPKHLPMAFFFVSFFYLKVTISVAAKHGLEKERERDCGTVYQNTIEQCIVNSAFFDNACLNIEKGVDLFLNLVMHTTEWRILSQV